MAEAKSELSPEEQAQQAEQEQAHAQALADSQPMESEEAARAAFDALARGEPEPEPGAAPAGEKQPPAQPPADAGKPEDKAPPEVPPKPATDGGPVLKAAAPAPAPAPVQAMQGFTAEEIEALRQLPNAMRTIGGRVAAMQGDLAKKLGGQAAAATTAQGKEAPTAAAIAEASKSTEKWNKLKEDFPEFGDAIDERLHGIANVDVESIAAKAREEARAEMEAKLEEQRETEIAEDHPEWKTTLRDQGFVDWFNAQPEGDRKKWYNSNSSRSISKMLDRYEESKQQSTTQAPAPAAAKSTAPAHDLAAAVTKRGGPGAPKLSESELEGKQLWDALVAKETAK